MRIVRSSTSTIENANVAGDGKALVEQAAREKPRCGATLVPDQVRSNIGPLNSMVAKHLPIQPLQAEHRV